MSPSNVPSTIPKNIASKSNSTAGNKFASQTTEELIKFVNERFEKTNPTMHFLNGSVLSFDESKLVAKIKFRTHAGLSNGGNQVQGGFSAAMLDASCAYLVRSYIFPSR
jgi:acyl-coenzyme A thioesterase PaaI-like protein